MSHYAVHMPIQAPPEMTAKYEEKAEWEGQSDPAYAAIKQELKQAMEAWILRIRDVAFLPEVRPVPEIVFRRVGIVPPAK